MEGQEAAKAKFDWVEKGELLKINHVDVSAYHLKEVIAETTKTITETMADLTFHANLQVKRAWAKDKEKEDPNNRAIGFSPITDRGNTILEHLARSSRRGRPP